MSVKTGKYPQHTYCGRAEGAHTLLNSVCGVSTSRRTGILRFIQQWTFASMVRILISCSYLNLSPEVLYFEGAGPYSQLVCPHWSTDLKVFPKGNLSYFRGKKGDDI